MLPTNPLTIDRSMNRRYLAHATAGPAPASLALVPWFAAQADRYRAGYLTVHPIDVARLRCDPPYGLKIFVAGIASHTRYPL
jgi:hypothetical protein